ncbi:hypothetical protein PMG11_08556 [Penicillium brasilianum]|uniref:SHSP domain-containing protein n=1 Tax=Penicillium brasilianum TaxID=104259 RepID=A0A0F7TT89_PENBI|nr:hypothetical protein PMG11_08556 [Penicillium brasilianum]
MSLIPHFHRGGLSAVSRLLDNYENMFSNLGQLQTYAPSFDVRETDKAYHLDGDLPGVQEKDLEIEFEDEHCLKIKAHSERESTTEKDSWLASESFSVVDSRSLCALILAEWQIHIVCNKCGRARPHYSDYGCQGGGCVDIFETR